ncbi:MAG: hypothetical protein WBX15_09820 [Thermoanaerobaculia bacterium]
MKRNQVRMAHAEGAEHLIHEQLGVGDHFEIGDPFVERGRQCRQKAFVFGHVVRRHAEEPADLDNVTTFDPQNGAETRDPWIPPAGPVDPCSGFQDATRSM